MKAKIFYLAMALVIAIPIAAAGVAFAANTTVWVDPQNQTKVIDVNFSINVSVEPVVEIDQVSLGLTWDPALVTLNDWSEGDLLNQDGDATLFMGGFINNDTGTLTPISGAITDGGSVSGPGTFVTLNLTTKAEGTSPLHLTNVMVQEKGVGPIDPVIVGDGYITITGLECFIATAAYGTSTAEELDTLRAFRDEVLLQNSLGSQLVTLYYEVSPPVADFISEHEVLRTLVREVLVDPVAWLVKATGTLWRD